MQKKTHLCYKTYQNVLQIEKKAVILHRNRNNTIFFVP